MSNREPVSPWGSSVRAIWGTYPNDLRDVKITRAAMLYRGVLIGYRRMQATICADAEQFVRVRSLFGEKHARWSSQYTEGYIRLLLRVAETNPVCNAFLASPWLAFAAVNSWICQPHCSLH